MRIHRYACWLGTLMLPAMLLAADPAPPPVKKDTMKPPVAPIRPFKVVGHNQTRTDNYYWLRERNNPEVIAHLKSENAYLDSTLAGVKPLRETLVNEFRKRIRQNDESAPWRKDGYLYYTRMVEGKNYPVLCRREGSMDAPEQVMVDGNKEGEGKSFFSIGSMDVSPDHKLLAWAADVVGRRRFTLRFRDLATGRDLAETLTDISSEVAWANDNKTVFYIRKDPQTLRAYQVWRHTLGTAPGSDKLIYEEKDTQFDLDIRRSKSGRFIFIESHQTLTGETLFLDANTPEGRFQVFEPRKRDRLYNVEHLGQYFFVRTNDQAKDFRLLRTPVTATTYQYWEEVVPHRPGTLLAGVQLFNEFLVMLERNAGVRGPGKAKPVTLARVKKNTRLDPREGGYSKLFEYLKGLESTVEVKAGDALASLAELEGPFDFVLVDGRARRFCIREGFQLLRDGGLLLLHDSQRTDYHDALEALQCVLGTPFGLPRGFLRL